MYSMLYKLGWFFQTPCGCGSWSPVAGKQSSPMQIYCVNSFECTCYSSFQYRDICNNRDNKLHNNCGRKFSISPNPIVDMNNHYSKPGSHQQSNTLLFRTVISHDTHLVYDNHQNFINLSLGTSLY